MRHVLTVFGKELVDNLRDRRTLLSALIMGPLLGPLLLATVITLTLRMSLSEVDEPVELAVIGVEHAPNLVAYLVQNNAAIVPPPEDARAAVTQGTHDIVLEIPDEFGEHLRAGEPAVVRLVADYSNKRTAKDEKRIRALLASYGDQIAALRLQVRGVSPLVTRPFAIEEVDVSTPAARALLVLGMVTYFLVFAMFMGAFYLAIDTTAGERERGSLEPLLALPVARSQLLLGKLCATFVFAALSLAVTLVAFAVSVRFVPLEELGMQAHFGVGDAARSFALGLPLVLFGAALLTLVASFTRSYKEAQTWLTLILFVPTLPILFAGLYSLRPSLPLMLVPSLSQHLLITQVMRNEAVEPVYVAVSVGATLVLGVVLIAITARRYATERLLG